MKRNLIGIEFLKIKRTLLFYLCLGFPLIITIIIFLYFLTDGSDMVAQASGEHWLFYSNMIQTFWALIFLPLFITLQTALLAGNEHNGKMWKLLYAQPVCKVDILRAKIVVNFMVIGLSQLLLLPLTLASGLLLRYLDPALGMEQSIPLAKIVLLDLTVYGLAFVAIALHTWVSLRWESFVTAVTFGIVATVSGIIVMNSGLAWYYPWSMPGLIANHLFEMDFPWMNLLYSIGTAAIIILACLLDLLQRDTE